MSLWSAFCGPAYASRSATISADAAINVFPETVRNQTKTSVLYGTPGLKFQVASGDTVERGSFSGDGRTFTVIGATLYEVNTAVSPPVLTSRGSIANDNLPCSLLSNGRGGDQLMIVGGSEVKIFRLTTNILSAAITLPLMNAPVMGAFMDGFFFLLEANTANVYYSNLEDGTIWNPLNVFTRSHTSDNLVGIEVLRDRLWTFGTLTTEVYYNSGNATSPFIPYPGSVIQEGCASPWSIDVLGEAVYWVSQNNLGRARVLRATSLEPEEISPPPISFALNSYATLSDCEVLTYTQEGHAFACWTCPSAPHGETWCFDSTEAALNGPHRAWHQRQALNTTTNSDTRWMARGAVSTPMGILCGSYSDGNLYTLDLDTFTDNGQPRRYLRRAPYLSAENQWLFLDQIELAAQTGVGTQTGQGTLAQVMLRISRDAAQTWSNAVFASVGAIGATLNRAIWRRLGRVRSDRLVVEVSQTDPVRPVWGPGLWIRATQGSGQL